MNVIHKSQRTLDKTLQRTPLVRFIYAVIWKYNDDKAGYLAALLTYYGFLALFPLLLIATTVAGMVSDTLPHLEETIVESVGTYFPTIGEQLAQSIQGIHQNGWALIAGLLFTLYGTRGVASAFRHGVNEVWHIPKAKRSGFPNSTMQNITIIAVGGFGLLLAAASSAAVISFNDHLPFRLIALGINVGILFVLFVALIKISLPKTIKLVDIWSAALGAAIGIVALQFVGGYLLAKQLHHLDALYSYFALSLGLMFWIYLQSQVIFYSLEMASVHAQKLWPRSLDGQIVRK